MSPRKQRGFTLLEMLAALVVMAVCSSVLLVAFGQSARSLAQVERSDRMSLAARSLFDEQGTGNLQPGTREGVVDGDIHWSLAITSQVSKSGQPRMMRLDLRLKQNRRQAQFSSLRLVSAAAPGDGT
jgi:general secretion pathway protein I